MTDSTEETAHVMPVTEGTNVSSPAGPPTTLAAVVAAPLRDSSSALTAPMNRRLYMSVTVKFVLSVAFGCLWVAACVWFSMPWVDDLTETTGSVMAWILVFLVAYLPGFLVAFLSMSLILDRQPVLRATGVEGAVTVIIAARNEEATIAETVRAIHRSSYPGAIELILADNGSTDLTVARARAAATGAGRELSVVFEPRAGKSLALNSALVHVATPYVVTVDADTILHGQALERLIARLESGPAGTVAVAGSVLVRNSRANLLTKMQEWDYYLGIAGVKRMQGMYQSTLVAQGAFSVYRTDRLRAVGGWPDAIGEDIVLTWRLMQDGSPVLFEPTAAAFTDAPTNMRHFYRQRARWARGMFEGLQSVPPWRQKRRLSRWIAGIDLLIPLLDVGYAPIWLPGLVLFLLGLPLVVSAWTLAVLPITLLVYGALRVYQVRRVFRPLRLVVRRNRLGYLAFLLAYQALCSTASLIGHTQFLTGRARRWK